MTTQSLGALSGRYRIEHELGRGGMAIVYLAQDLKLDREVAIKVVRPEYAGGVSHERFVREIRIATALSHPNVVGLYDADEADGVLYYVMPRVAGETLRARLHREKRLEIGEAVRIAFGIAAALEYAHAQGIVHRDIKPDNVFLERGHVLVSDFGLARALDDSAAPQLTDTGIVIGTAGYMSPEQAMGEAVDARTDIYSLACVLFEMLAGEPPFTSTSVRGVLAKQVAQPPPSVRLLRDTVPQPVEQALIRALAKTPADRFPSIATFRQALIASAPRRRLTGVRVRRAMYVSVALLALVGAGLYARRVYLPDDAAMSSLVVLPFADLSSDTAGRYFVDGMHEGLIEELSQIAALRVISRTSAMQYRGGTKTIPQIARELNVDAVLEGSAYRSGDSIRLDLSLVRARPEERQIWSEKFGDEVANVTALHRAVVLQIARRMSRTLSVAEKQRLQGARRVDPVAYEEYLRAGGLQSRFNADDVAEAAAQLQHALSLDPNFAPAWAAMAGIFIAQVNVGATSSREAAPKAMAAARRALALDSGLAEAESAIARIKHRLQWDWAGADASYRRAIALSPSTPWFHSSYANFLRQMNRGAEALTQLQLAEEYEPRAVSVAVSRGMFRLFDGDFSGAIASFEEIRRVVPKHLAVNNGLWQAYWGIGDLDRALAAAKRRFAAVNDGETVAAMERGFREGGYRGAMAEAASNLEQRNRATMNRAFFIAQLYGHAQDTAQTLFWLERAYDAREPDMAALRSAPDFRELRSLPRFQALVDRMHFPPDNPAQAR